MTNDYVMPKLAMAMNEGTINAWLVSDGAFVKKGQPIITVETEKVSYDLESPYTGYLQTLVAEGETVPVEVTIARISETDTGSAPAMSSGQGDHDVDAAANVNAPVAAAPAKTAGDRLLVTPVVKKLAREHGVDLTTIVGSGPGGRIVKRDILDAVERGPAKPAETETAAVNSRSPSPAASGQQMRELARITIKGKTRATIATRMVQSLQSTAQLSSSWESDITDLLAARDTLTSRADQWGTRVSVNALLIKALICAIRQVPLVNSALSGDDIILFENINVGIAVALPGLTEFDSTFIVPVLKNADRMGVVEIDKGMKSLIERARKGELQPEDMTGSTITFSSTAGLAPPGLKSTPILNTPNSMVIGPSTPIDKPVVVNGNIVVRTMLPMSITFDHRIIDGEPAARFGKHLHDCLEHPELMLA